MHKFLKIKLYLLFKGDDANQFFESCRSCLTHNLRSGRGYQISTTVIT